MALLRGTLDTLVLKALSWGPMHAYEITSWLEDRSGGRLGFEDAALIQSLHRMEEKRLISAEWGVTKNGRKARYYQLSAVGRQHLKAEVEALTESIEATVAVLSLRRA
jgi:DNA-binding PadR family transcriptional regulator